MHSAISLIVVFFAIFGMYLLLHAEFLAVIQVLVYTGAIIVLYLFALMVLDLSPFYEESPWIKWSVRSAFLGTLFFFIFFELSVVIVKSHFPLIPDSNSGSLLSFTPSVIDSLGGNTAVIGKALFTKYLIPFEITGILFIVALVGAVVIARREE